MILVTGATGQFGRATLEFLVQRVPAAELAGLARDPAKAADLAAQGIAIRPGDYEDYPSLVRALQGVDKVLLVSAVAFTDRLAQHTNVINAAQEAGVKQVVYTSIQRQHDAPLVPGVSESDLKTEQRLRESGLTYTILNNTLYADSLPLFLGSQVLTTGVQVPVQPGEGRVSYATRRDLAEAAATVLTQPGHENRAYTLTGAEAPAFSEVAELLSQLKGGPVAYVPLTPAAYAQHLASEGLPQPLAEYLTHWAEAFNQGMCSTTDPALERLLGRRPTALKDFLRAVYFPSAGAAAASTDSPSYFQKFDA